MIIGIRNIKKIVSYILVICMVAGGTIVNLPQIVFAAVPASPTFNNTALNNAWAVFGNGYPLLIVEGTNDGETAVYWDKNNNGMVDASDEVVVASCDMSNYWIFGGCQTGTDVASTKITMTGGCILRLTGGGLNSKVTGDVTLNLSGGKVISELVGGGANSSTNTNDCSVGGKITINVSGDFTFVTETDSNFIGGCYGYGNNSTKAREIEINITNATGFGRNTGFYASGMDADQDGTTTVNITNSTVSLRGYGGIYRTGGTSHTKSGDLQINIQDSTTSGFSLGGTNDGVIGNASITVTDSTVAGINGAGDAGNVTGDVNITIRGASTITNAVYAAGSNGGSVGGDSVIDISGTTTVGYYVYGRGSSSSSTVAGSSILKLSGDLTIGHVYNSSYSGKTYYGIDLSTFTDNIITIKGALTGTTGKILLLLPNGATGGTVVATPEVGITANAAPFYSASNDFYVLAGDVVVDGRTATVSAEVKGIAGVALDSQTGTLTISDDTFTGVSVGNDITSWFSVAGDLGIAVTVSNVTGGTLGLSFTGTPNSEKSKTYMQVNIPATKLTSGIAKKIVSTGSAYYYILEDGAVDYYLYFDSVAGKLYIDGDDEEEYTGQADKWYVDEDGNLVLNGFNLTTVSDQGLELSAGSKVILAEGSINNIKCVEEAWGAVYSDEGDVTIEGPGILNITLQNAGEAFESYAYGNSFSIINATINITGGSEAEKFYLCGFSMYCDLLYIENSDITINFINAGDNTSGIVVNSSMEVVDSDIEITIGDEGASSTNIIYIDGPLTNFKLQDASITAPIGAAMEETSNEWYGNTYYETYIKLDGNNVTNHVKIESTIQKHFVTRTLSNVTVTSGTTGTRKAIKGTDYTTTLTAKDGYVLPGAITIKVGGNTLNTSDYTYNTTTGVITIPGAKLTGDVVITATGSVPGGGGNNNGGNNNGENNNGGNNNGGNNNGGNNNGGNNNGGNNNGGNNNGGNNNGGNNNGGNNNGGSNNGDVQKDVVKDEKAPQTSFNNSLAALEDLLFTDAEKALIQAGANARIYLEVHDIGDTVSVEDKALITNNIGRLVIGEYIDISLFKQIGDNAAQRINNPNGLISITIVIPEDLLLDDSSKTRTYKIARIHDGEFTLLDGDFDVETGEFTFATDKFSTYAIVYQDVDNNVEPPQTGDNSFSLIWMLLMASSAVMVSAFILKNSEVMHKKKEESK